MPDRINELLPYATSGGFAAFGGALSYLLKIQEGKKFTWTEFILHTTISAMCGLVTFPCLSYAGLPADLCGALCGVAGWMGTRLMRLMEIVISKKMGVSTEEINK